MAACAERRLIPNAPGTALPLEHPDAQRAAISLFLDIMAIGRPLGDPMDLLILGAVVQANNAPVAGRADLQLRYAGLGTPAPNELRRPITMHAAATSLGLSFESVRRRLHGLVKRGVCTLEDGGILVSTEALSSGGFRAAALAAYDRLQAYHQVLGRHGLLDGLPPATARLHGDEPPVRATLRVGLDYMLRVSDAARAGFGDLRDCLILFEIVRANTEHLGDAPRREQAAELLGDGARRPTTVTVLARRLGVAAETARRHVLELQSRGDLARVKGGLIVPMARLARPDVARFAAENLRQARRLFSALSAFGVLDAWRRADGGEPTA